MAAIVKIQISQEGSGNAAQQAKKDIEELGQTAEKAGGGFSALHEIGVGALRELGAIGLNVLGSLASKLTSFISDGVNDAREAAKIMAQTEAVIKSTGGAAGVSAQHVADLASSLSAAAGKSLFGDDQIQQSNNMLLTFTNVKGAVLDTATAVSVDMAQAFGGAPKDAAIQLGKALNDPVKGITALSRVGVTFSEEQKDMIQAMVDMGDVAGAQGVILAELNKEFGGSAEAAAKADGGMAQLKDQLGELGESIGTALLPIINQLIGFLITNVVPVVQQAADVFTAWLGDPTTQANIQAIATAIQSGLSAAMNFLTTTVIPALIAGWGLLQPAIATVVGLFQSSGGEVSAVGTIFTNLATIVMPIVDAAIQVAAGFWMNVLMPALNLAWNIITTVLVPALTTLTGWLAQILPPAIQVVANFLTGTLFPALGNVYNFINANVVPILSTLVVWLRDNIPPAAQKVADFWNNTILPALNAVWAFIQNNVIPIFTTVVAWLTTNIPVAAQATADMWNNTLKPALSAVWEFIQNNIIPLFTALASLLDAVVGLAVKVFAALWTGTLKPALEAVGAFITGTLNPALSAIATAMSPIATAITSTLTPAFTGLKDNVLGPVASAFGSISSAIQGVIGWINDVVEKLNSVEIPDWLEGNSPPPMADWFSFIGDAAGDLATKALPTLNTNLNAVAPQVGLAAQATDARRNRDRDLMQTYNQQRALTINYNGLTNAPAMDYNTAMALTGMS